MAVDNAIVDLLLREFHFPERALFNKVVAKENFVKSSRINKSKKELIAKKIQQINWVFIFKESTTNISETVEPKLPIKEIDFLTVEVRDGGKINTSLASSILDVLPNPAILQLNWEIDSTDMYQWFMADYRVKKNTEFFEVNQLYASKVMQRDELPVFAQYAGFNQQDTSDMFRFYESILDNMERFKFINGEVNDTPLADTLVSYRTLNKKSEELNAEILKLQVQAKKEKQLNKRAKLVNQTRDLMKQLESIKKGNL
ncbi:MAG: DUF4391 domain-containing protein [Lactobacillaceae bacterium]|jgi:hypothetical protein|nr:DUF4391 domain-containing protein [Lactobacillaceae bacterium]